jgi:hypothetical protein
MTEPITEQPTNTRLKRRHAFQLSLVAIFLVYILWNVPQLSFLVYPLRLFVTYVHEAGHGLAALISGGEVIGFSVSADGSGLATTRGGSRALILPAGYLGAAFFGAALFYVTNRLMRPRAIAILLGAFLIGFTLMFARPDADGLPIALAVGLIGGMALIGMGWKLRSSEVNFVVLNVLALMTALNAVFDLLYVVRASDAALRIGNDTIRNDAAAFSAEVAPVLPASAWAVIWAIMAVAMIGAAAWYSLVQPMLRTRAEKRFFEQQARIRRKPQTEPERPKAHDPFPWETWDD